MQSINVTMTSTSAREVAKLNRHLANAYDAFADELENNRVLGTQPTPAPTTSPKKTKAAEPVAEPEEEVDEFSLDDAEEETEETPEHTPDTVTKAFGAFAKKASGNREICQKILKKIGVKSVRDLDGEQCMQAMEYLARAQKKSGK